MAQKVIVHDVNSLDEYCRKLSSLKTDLDGTVTKLAALSDELKNKASELGNATEAQGSNWSDPQYVKLKDEVKPCVSAVNSTAASVTQTAGVIRAKAAEIDRSITYIRNLISKLRNM